MANQARIYFLLVAAFIGGFLSGDIHGKHRQPIIKAKASAPINTFSGWIIERGAFKGDESEPAAEHESERPVFYSNTCESPEVQAALDRGDRVVCYPAERRPAQSPDH